MSTNDQAKRRALAEDMAAALNADIDTKSGLTAEDVMDWWQLPVGWEPAPADHIRNQSQEPLPPVMRRPKKHREARVDTSLHTDYDYPPCMSNDGLQDLFPAGPLAYD